MGRQVGGNGSAAQGDTGSQSTWGPGGKSASHGGMKAALPDGRGPAKVRVARPAPRRAGDGEEQQRAGSPWGGAGDVWPGPTSWRDPSKRWTRAPGRESQALGTDFPQWKLGGRGPVVGVPGGSLRAWAVREVGVWRRAPWAGGNRPGPGAAEPVMLEGGPRDPGGAGGVCGALRGSRERPRQAAVLPP